MGTAGKKWTSERRARQMARISPLLDRIVSRVEFDTVGGCWLWTGAMVTATGYGTIGYDGRSHGAHRASWVAHHGLIPPGLVVCHRCDVRACVNPNHLFLGTTRENHHDMIRKGRANPRRGDAVSRAILSAAQIPDIRTRIRAGDTNRAIADDFGVSPDVINAIRVGRSWRCVPDAQARAA